MSKLTETQKHTKAVFEKFTEKWYNLFSTTDITSLGVSNITGLVDECTVRWCDMVELDSVNQFKYKVEYANGIVITYDIRGYVKSSVFRTGKTNSISFNIYKDRCVETRPYYHVELSPNP